MYHDLQMHKTRYFLPPIPPIAPGSYDLYNPSIRLVVLPKSSLKVTGPFAELTKAVRETAERNAGRKIEMHEDEEVVVPVHELQVWHVEDKFPEARILDGEFRVAAKAQQSIRCAFLFSVFEANLVLTSHFDFLWSDLSFFPGHSRRLRSSSVSV